jgi:hypothetical protein
VGSPSESPSSESATPSDTGSTEPAGPTDTPSSGVLPPTASGRTLTLSDVFATVREWEESRYDVADRSEIQGIGTTLRDCGESYLAGLELRLAHRFTKLTMNVGQANDSPNSDRNVVVEILANEKQQDTRRIPFDRIQPFTVDVRDVNALKLRFWIDDADGCSYESRVVLVVEKLTVFG